MKDRIFLNDYLENYFDEVSPREFYRDIFPAGELEEQGVQIPGKYNGVAVELLPKEQYDLGDKLKHNAKRYLLTDGLEILDQLLESDNFIIISPISYAGKSRQSNNARFIYAIAIDLDGITEEHYLTDLFHQIEIEYLPKPTYIVWSGSGLHLYYQLEKPIPCFKNIVKQLAEFKTELTKKIWNVYVSELYQKPQIESLFQGFRLVGGITKGGNRTRAYSTGSKVTMEYLNTFVPEEAAVKQFTYKSDLSLQEAEKKYPEWFKRRIIEKKPRGTWTANKAVYDWWLGKLNSQIATGHRYYGIMVLAIYAKKCGVSRDILEHDAYGLIEKMEELTVSEDNHFTREDVLAALEMFNDNYITFPIDSISTLTAIAIEKNKRNGRKQADHIKLMNFIRDEINHNTDWRNKDGRPNKKAIIEEWQRNHKYGTVKECIADTGASRNTVYKYWTKWGDQHE
jgi:hypothetical protein